MAGLMPVLGCLTLLCVLLLVVLLPVAFGQLFASALLKLRLDPATAALLVAAIIVGGAVNLPVKRIVRPEPLTVDPMAVFGLLGRWPRLQRLQRETVVAVNVGGCVIPSALAIYEAAHLFASAPHTASAVGASALVNIGVCYRLARPLKGIGIALPGLVPPVLAALCALVLATDHDTPVAFIAGVLGPLVGADLLHLRDIERIEAGIFSIGGAGTFDGIVLSGIVAAYLA
jgi:uncharacterized membrane protein